MITTKQVANIMAYRFQNVLVQLRESSITKNLLIPPWMHSLIFWFHRFHPFHLTLKPSGSVLEFLKSINSERVEFANWNRAYIIIPICFHFADQYKWPKLRSCLVLFSKKFLSIKGGGEKVLKYWSGSLDTVRRLPKQLLKNRFAVEIDTFV